MLATHFCLSTTLLQHSHVLHCSCLSPLKVEVLIDEVVDTGRQSGPLNLQAALLTRDAADKKLPEGKKVWGGGHEEKEQAAVHMLIRTAGCWVCVYACPFVHPTKLSAVLDSALCVACDLLEYPPSLLRCLFLRAVVPGARAQGGCERGVWVVGLLHVATHAHRCMCTGLWVFVVPCSAGCSSCTCAGSSCKGAGGGGGVLTLLSWCVCMCTVHPPYRQRQGQSRHQPPTGTPRSTKR